jgi:hypothetical protein
LGGSSAATSATILSFSRLMTEVTFFMFFRHLDIIFSSILDHFPGNGLTLLSAYQSSPLHPSTSSTRERARSSSDVALCTQSENSFISNCVGGQWSARTRVQDEIGHNVILQYLLQDLFTGRREEVEAKARREALECEIARCKKRDNRAVSLNL